MKPEGGLDDYSAFFHESGHAQHFAYEDPKLSFAKALMGNNTVTEIGTSPTITGLAAGDYTVQATNLVTGCTDTELITIIDNILIPTVTPTVVANQMDCLPADGAA